MRQYYTRKVLDENQLKTIKEILKQADDHNLWMDGLNSGGGFSRVKKNLELSSIELSQSINSMIMNSLDQDKNFIDFTVADSTNLNIVSKTSSGSYYNPHIDSWFNGDYSTTVFLNDPNEYIGGELCLYFGGEEETKIKLDAGWAVTYSTGILHRVNKVISGNRYVSVFWTKSHIKDSFIRYIYSEIGSIQQNMVECENPVHLSNCLSVYKDPYFCLDNLKNQILRRYSGS
jgi:PKHD-type hydroxylase